MARGSGTVVVKFLGDTKGLTNSIDEVESTLGRFSGKLQDAGKSMMRVGGLMTAGVTVPVVAGFKQIFDAASDLNEVQSKSDTIFGKSGRAINMWAQGAARDFGLSRKGALEAAGTFGNLFVQLGYTTEQAMESSTAITELAADFASFHNADITQVIEAQTAAFRGEYDALQRFVPTINAATVEQKALTMTGKALTAELTAQEKALAVEALMLENAGDALGDFDRTSDSAANKQRILGAQFADVSATLGQQLLPLGTQLLGMVAGWVEKFTQLTPTMQKVVIGGAALLAALGPLVTTGGALLTVVGLLLSPVGAAVAALAALTAGVIYAYKNFEGFRKVVDGVAQWFEDVAIPAVGRGADFMVEKFRDVQRWVDRIWPQIQEAIRHVLAVIETTIRVTMNAVQTVWRTVGDDLLRFAKVVWDTISRTVEAAMTFVKSTIETVLAVINGDWARAWDGIKNMFGAVWDQIGNIHNLALGALRFAVGATLSTLVAWFGELPGKIVAALAALPDMLAEAGSWAIRKYLSAIRTAAGAVKDWFSELPGKIVGWIGDLSKLLFNKGKELIGGLISGIRDAAGALGGIVGGIIGSLGDGPGAPRASGGRSFADPGPVGGKTLQRIKAALPQGLYITSTYRTPEQNRRVGGSPTSYHMDRNNPAVDIGGPVRLLDAFYERLRGMGGWRELLWRVKGHYDHIHAAHSGGIVSSSWPRSFGDAPDERTTRLQVGEVVLPKGHDMPSELPDPVAWGRTAAREMASELRMLMRSA